MHVVPVRGGNHGHLFDGEVLVEHVERGSGAAAAGDSHASRGLVGKGTATCVERAVESRENATRGVRVIHGRAKHEAIGGAGSLDEFVHHVVADDTTPAQLRALAASDAVIDGLGAEPKHLRLDAVGFKRTRHFRQRHRGVAVLPRASVYKQNLHCASSLPD